jgi:hypothetical protein
MKNGAGYGPQHRFEESPGLESTCKNQQLSRENGRHARHSRNQAAQVFKKYRMSNSTVPAPQRGRQE